MNRIIEGTLCERIEERYDRWGRPTRLLRYHPDGHVDRIVAYEDKRTVASVYCLGPDKSLERYDRYDIATEHLLQRLYFASNGARIRHEQYKDGELICRVDYTDTEHPQRITFYDPKTGRYIVKDFPVPSGYQLLTRSNE